MRAPVKLGLFGGTFDPVHLGHLIVAQSAMEATGLARVLFVPSSSPPHKTGPSREPEASFAHRLRMVELAVASNDRFSVTDREGRREGASYTVDFLRDLRATEGEGAEFYFLIGADWIESLGTWKDIDSVFDLCSFLVVPRPGFPREGIARASKGLSPEWARALDEGWTPVPEIGMSSTGIRERLTAGLPIRYFVPPPVEAYIHEHGLYGATSRNTKSQ